MNKALAVAAIFTIAVFAGCSSQRPTPSRDSSVRATERIQPAGLAGLRQGHPAGEAHMSQVAR